MTLTESSHKNDNAMEQFRQVYRWQLRQNRVLYAVYAALTLLCYTAVFLTGVYSSWQDYLAPGAVLNNIDTPKGELVQDFSEAILNSFNVCSAMSLVPLTMLFLAVYCVVTFGYMHRRRSVDLFHALPVRRTPLLLGGMAAGCTVMAVVTSVSMLLCFAGAAAFGASAPFTFPLLLGKLALLLLLLAAAMALTVTLLVCSGTVMNAVISGILIMGGWPMLCVCAAWIISQTLPGSTVEASLRVVTLFVPYLAALLPFTGPITRFLADDGTMNVPDPLLAVSPGLILWWVCFTAVLLAAAVLIYRRRPSEQAENNFSFPPLRVFIQFLMACAVGLAAGAVFGAIYNNNVVFFLAVLIFSAAAHCVTQIIWVRGMDRFRKSLPAYGAAVAAMAVFFVILATGGLGFVNRMPAPDEVENVRLTLPGYHYDDSVTTYLGDYCGMSLQKEEVPDSEMEEGMAEDDYTNDVSPKLESPESVKAVRDMHRKLIALRPGPYLPCHEGWYNELTITYQYDGGKTLYRSYKLPEERIEKSAPTGEGQTPKSVPGIDGDVLKSMARVVALKEFQECSITPFLKGKDVQSISCSLPRKGGSESVSAYDRSMGLTPAQAEKVWTTFQTELKSKDFRYTWEEVNGSADAEDFAQQESYSIEVEDTWRCKDWPAGLRRVVEKNVREPWEKQDEKRLICAPNNVSYNVPECCVKTRKLIRAYTADVRQFYSDEEMEVE